MGQGFNKALGAIYKWIPPAARPFFKSAFIRTQIRLAGILSGRRVRRGKRVAFLDFEIAHLEDFEYLSPGRDEIEIEVCSTTVSPGTERAVLCGLPGSRRGFPYIPGYSSAGRIKAIGSRVKGLKIGDTVAGRVKHASGDSVKADLVFSVPTGIDMDSASFIELGIIVLQGVRKARIEPGDTVAVLGQGLIGQLANRLARALSAGEVIALAPSRNRATVSLLPGGADRFIETRSAAFDPDSIAADIVIEAVGTPDAIAMAARCAREGGRVVLLGSSRGLSPNVNLAQLLQSRRLELIGAHISNMPAIEASPGRHTYRQEGELFLDLIRCGRLTVRDLVTWRPAPQECNSVYEQLADGGHAHVAIVFDWQKAQA